MIIPLMVVTFKDEHVVVPLLVCTSTILLQYGVTFYFIFETDEIMLVRISDV